jgi:hypothetical protein
MKPTISIQAQIEKADPTPQSVLVRIVKRPRPTANNEGRERRLADEG